MAGKTTKGTYSEAEARAEARLAILDLERGRARLREIQKRLQTLPAYKVVDAAQKKGDEEAVGFAWWLNGTCDETARDLEDEHLPGLKKDIRHTDASLKAMFERQRKEREAYHKKAERARKKHPPDYGVPPVAAQVVRQTAASLKLLAPVLRSRGIGDDLEVGAKLADCLKSLSKNLLLIAGPAPRRGRTKVKSAA